jgi:aminoglycoside phosphotransferase family enzyme/predicted kinase
VTSPPLVEALLDPQAYPDSPSRVELVETHISHLFLTGSFVYKVKKSVDFGFLDFTALEKRRHFCQEEVRLNRRLSPQVYLGVVEIRRQGLRYRMEGPGLTVEYAVKMRQLPRDRSLQALLQKGEATPLMVQEVACLLADFHQRAETGEEVSRAGGFDAVCFNVRENFTQIEPYIGRTLSQGTFNLLRASSETFLEAQEALFRRREAQGRVRDGHGDLHTAQIFFAEVGEHRGGAPGPLGFGIQIIDCIEFNQRFRYGDVAGDIAFLAMDLDFHGRQDLAESFVAAYQEASEDRELRELLDFFKAYRACVRGKVEGFRLEDPAVPPAQREAVTARAARYFDLAASYARPFKRPALLLTAGLMGTGKSTLAADLADSLRGPVLASDVLRKELAGIPLEERREAGWGEGLYAEETLERVYQEMHRRARALLLDGQIVVLDASYRKRSWRASAAALAQELEAPFYLLECVCPEEIVRERLQLRRQQGGGPSDGRWALYGRQKEAFEPVTELPAQSHLVVDTVGGRQEVAFRALKALCLRARAEGQPAPLS